jgi:hypothetical protein
MNDTNYLCCTEILGLELSEDTVLTIDSTFILTNSVEYIFANMITDKERFQEKFGELHMLGFAKNHCYLFNCVSNNRSDSFHLNNNFIAGILDQLWTIKDNSVFAFNFYYIPKDPRKNYILNRLNFSFLNSKGEAIISMFTDLEITSTLSKIENLKKFISKKEETSSENIGSVSIHTGQKSIEYNNLTRIERGLRFLSIARRQHDLPLKITNYISFIECLFSTTGIEISHQVAERTAIFLNLDNQEIKIKTYQFVKSCYAIRSKYVHGSPLTKKHKNLIDLQSHSYRLDEICRQIKNIIIDKDLLIFNGDDESLEKYFLNLIFKN